MESGYPAMSRAVPTKDWTVKLRANGVGRCGEQGPLEGSRVLQDGAETPRRGRLWAVPLKETQGGNTHFYGERIQNKNVVT